MGQEWIPVGPPAKSSMHFQAKLDVARKHYSGEPSLPQSLNPQLKPAPKKTVDTKSLFALIPRPYKILLYHHHIDRLIPKARETEGECYYGSGCRVNGFRCLLPEHALP